MEEILVYLIAIQRGAKGIHYRSNGNNFWSDHKLADKIFEDIEDFIDEVFEVCYLGREKDLPQEKSLLSGASGLVPLIGDDMVKAFARIDELIINCLSEIEMELQTDQITVGETDVLGRVGSNLQKKHGWILRRLRGV